MKPGTKSRMMFLVIQTKTPTLWWADLQKSGYNCHQCRLSLRDLQPLQTDALVVNTLSCLPTLTYSKGRPGRFSWSFPSVPSSILTVAERIIALGTHDGTVHLLAFQGNQVLSPHPCPPPPDPPPLSLLQFNVPPYNNPLQCEGSKTPVILQFAKS